MNVCCCFYSFSLLFCLIERQFFFYFLFHLLWLQQHMPAGCLFCCCSCGTWKYWSYFCHLPVIQVNFHCLSSLFHFLSLSLSLSLSLCQCSKWRSVSLLPLVHMQGTSLLLVQLNKALGNSNETWEHGHRQTHAKDEWVKDELVSRELTQDASSSWWCWWCGWKRKRCKDRQTEKEWDSLQMTHTMGESANFFSVYENDASFFLSLQCLNGIWNTVKEQQLCIEDIHLNPIWSFSPSLHLFLAPVEEFLCPVSFLSSCSV